MEPDQETLHAWIAEAKQRMEELRLGTSPTIPAAEVFRKGRVLIERAQQLNGHRK